MKIMEEELEEHFSEYHFAEAPKILVKPPGPRASELLRTCSKYDPRTAEYYFETAWHSAKGATLRDVDNNLFLDLSAGLSVLNVGHCNPVVTNALCDQAKMIWYPFPRGITEVRARLNEALAAVAPCGLRNDVRMMFAVAGSDAVECAVMLARYHTRRHTIVSFQGAFHGSTTGALALTSNVKLRKGVTPLMPDTYWVPYAYCYRCAFQKQYPECRMACINYIENCLKDSHSGLDRPAAVIVEPVQGEGGYIVPPDEFLPELRRICTENDVPLIVDEIQTGMGRTGKMFAVEHWNVTPDIMTLSKSLAGGFPLGMVLSHRRYLDEIDRLVHGGTFQASSLACAVALATLQFIRDNRLCERADKLGRCLIDRLRDLREECRIVGDVRGKGLMVGIELVKNRETREPLDEDLTKEFRQRMFERGVLVLRCGHWGNVIRLMPALTITRELLDKGVDIMIDTVKDIERKV
jgi:4-aminobutyrate aminotransferase